LVAQAPGGRQARRRRRGAAGAVALAEGRRPGRHPRQGGAGQTAGRRAEGAGATVGRRRGALEEGGGAAEGDEAVTKQKSGTVLVALTLGGAWLYVKSERDARQA